MPDAIKLLFSIGAECYFDIPQCIKVSFENNNVNDQTSIFNDSSIFNEMDVTECFL